MNKPKVPALPTETVERNLEVLRQSQDLSAAFWRLLAKDVKKFAARIDYLLYNATKDDGEAVKIALKLLDKIVPDAPSPAPKGGNVPQVGGIVFNFGGNLDREDPKISVDAIELK